jgi:hypothetical protein
LFFLAGKIYGNKRSAPHTHIQLIAKMVRLEILAARRVGASSASTTITLSAIQTSITATIAPAET